MTSTLHAGAPMPLRAHFDRLYAQDDDPWQVERRWYEQRKRALLLASLPQRRYRNGFEPGCGNGATTLALAPRCDRLLASDGAPQALRAAQRRLNAAGGMEHVTLRRQQLPDDWPAGFSRSGRPRFDLIVVSEIGYYLDAAALERLRDACLDSLAPDGTITLCHWRRPFADRVLPTDQVHDAFDASSRLFRLTRHREDDFLLDVWSGSAASVAQREGLAS